MRMAKGYTGREDLRKPSGYRCPCRRAAAEGLEIFLENGWGTGLSKQSYDALFQFHLDNEAIVNRLCFSSRIRPDFYMDDDLPFFASFQEHYRHRLEHGVPILRQISS